MEGGGGPALFVLNTGEGKCIIFLMSDQDDKEDISVVEQLYLSQLAAIKEITTYQCPFYSPDHFHPLPSPSSMDANVSPAVIKFKITEAGEIIQSEVTVCLVDMVNEGCLGVDINYIG